MSDTKVAAGRTGQGPIEAGSAAAPGMQPLPDFRISAKFSVWTAGARGSEECSRRISLLGTCDNAGLWSEAEMCNICAENCSSRQTSCALYTSKKGGDEHCIKTKVNCI